MGHRAPPTTTSLLCDSPEPTFAVAMSGEVVGWNAAVAQLLGIPEPKAVGRKCWSVLAGRAPDGTHFCRATCPILQAARAGRSSAPVEVVRGRLSRGGTARVGGGQPHVVLHHLALRDPGGQPSAVVHLVEEIAQQRRREMVGERLRAVATGTGVLGVRFTRREREMLGMLVAGLTTREAAERLGIRPTTARNYIQRVLAKLGAPNRLAAVMKLLWVNDTARHLVEPEVTGPAHADVAVPDGERVAQLESALVDLGRAQAARARLARVFDESSDEVYVFDAGSLRFVDVNAAARRNLGYSDEELAELTPVDLKPEFTPDSFAAMLEPLRRGERDQLVFETGHRRKNGSLYPVEVRLQLLATETPPVFIALVLDVTDRRRAEAERVRLAAAVDQTADSIMITALDGEIVYVNPAFEHVTGYSRSEVIGRAPSFLKSGRHDAAFYRAMWETLGRGEVWAGPIVNRCNDGTFYDAEVVISPVRDAAGRITHYVEVGRDVTYERALEAQLRQAQKMEAVGQLAGGIAHDFNNLLTAIGGYSDLLLSGMRRGDRRRAEVEEIRRAADRASALTGQLLAFSRRQVLQPRVVDLNDVVVGVVPLLRRLIGEHIDVVTALAPDVGVVRADPTQLEQVIVNLALNARDAMPTGGSLTIETVNADLDAEYARQHMAVAPGSYVLLAVTDTGIGMDAATQARLFEPFFTTKEFGKGTGLGLATVYGIVKQSGGYIWAYSEPGHGSSFKVYLPRVEDAVEPADAPRRPSAVTGGSETVMVVEDEEAVRGLISRVLERHGYRVLAAPDGEAAQSLFAQDAASIALLVTDIVMPRMSGVDLAQRLVEQRPGLRVLYLSGYTENSVTHHGLPLGTAFLGKPFSPVELARKVREVLDVEPDAGG